MGVKKPKKLDRATLSRLKKEKRCFDPGHGPKIEKLQRTVKELKMQLSRMVSKRAAFDDRRRAREEGEKEGATKATEALRAQRACFENRHRQYDGKNVMHLSPAEIASVIDKMSGKIMFSGDVKLSVLVPKDIVPHA